MTDLRGQAEAAQGRHHTTGSAAPQVRLSCEMCRRRKIKCDKLDPCSNCQRMRIACVPVERARLPRGRSGRSAAEKRFHHDTRLKDRISRLESLIRGITDNSDNETTVGGFPSSKASCSTRSRESTAQPPSPGERSQCAGTDGSQSSACSWRGLFRRSCGQTSPSTRHESRNMCYQRLLLMARGCENQRNTTEKGELVSRITEQKLCQIYLQRVDPFFKILHRPSLSAFLIDGKPYLNYAPGNVAPKALKYAVCFAAICSLDEDEYKHIFKTNKSLVVERYQKEAESMLAQADYITTNDLTVLQAFVLFLLSSRAQDQSRRVWTMLSIALRIAQALSLDVADPPFSVRPFEREMRRRLWTAIGFLDIQASIDRASEPMMPVDWLQSHPPLNVNDDEISFGMENPVQESTGFTDMTFTMISLKAQCVSRILNFTSVDWSVEPINSRQQLVLDFQHTASTLLQHAQPNTIAFHWFASHTAECINACMQLVVLRPLKQHPKHLPPRVHGDRLLKLAVDVLLRNQEIRNNPRALPWRWIEYTFIPWHALAVAASELCVCQDPTMMAKYWAPVEQSYERLSRLVADTSAGRIWKPMENIMAQARIKREQLFLLQRSTTRPSFLTDSSHPHRSASSTNSLHPPHGFTQPVPHNDPSNIVIPPLETIGLSPWPSVWDAVDWTNPLEENEMSWLNYENFLEDLRRITDQSSINQ